MLEQLVELGAIEFRPEPLDALIEWRLKHAWQQAPCPDCGDHTVQTSEDSPRIGDRDRGAGVLTFLEEG
jgi:hypothetical protein